MNPAALALLPEGGALLVRQAVGRNMPRRKRERLVDIALPSGERLARHAEDQIEREIGDPPANALDGSRHIARRMPPLEYGQSPRIERLDADTHAIDAVIRQHGDLFIRETLGGGFD